MKKRLLSVGLACCLLLLSGCSGVSVVMKSVKDGDADEANRLFREKIAGNSDKEFDLEDSLQAYIENLYEDLNSGKVSAADAQTTLTTIYTLEMSHSSYTQKILSKLDALTQSKRSYDDAMDAIAAGNYLAAYQFLENVIAADTNYETARTKQAEIINDGMRSLNREIDDAMAKKDFQKAIDLVNDAIELWGNNEFLAGMLDYIPEQWMQSSIDQAEQLRQEERYAEAREKAVEGFEASGLEAYPDEVTAELQKIDTEWLDSVAKKAENAFGTNKDYQAAIHVLQESGLYGDGVDALIAKYQGYAPVLLKEFKPIAVSSYMWVGATYESNYTDVNGNVYDKNTVILPRSRTSADIAESESDSYITYYLYGEYQSFNATLFRTYKSLSVKEENWPQKTIAKVYGDGVLLYEGPQITRDTYDQYTIHADVTGVRELKIVLLGVGKIYDSTYQTMYDYYPLLAIANATIQK